MENPQGPGVGSPPPTASLPPAAATSPPSDQEPDHDYDHDEDHPDFSPVGSPDLAEPLLPPPAGHLPPSALTDDLRMKIVKQVEYYFSDENLPNDNFLLKYVRRNTEGYVPIGVIASFRKMKKLTKDTSLIVAALKESNLVVVSSNGKKVKRVHPIALPEVKDPMVCTVLVENLPGDHSVENLRKVFGEAGNVKHITIRDPHDARDPKKCTVAEKLISGRLHALIEYDTVEAAEKAVATLNNEQDWRYGLRVKLLKKESKPGQKKKAWREFEPEKPISNKTEASVVEENHCSSEQHNDSHDEDTDHLPKDKNGVHLPKDRNGQKGQNRGRGRRQYQGSNGHGHGTQTSSHHIVEAQKPPPGPKMPDGTRGFTMGRGRPLATS